MDRTQILSTMTELKLFGMKAAYDEIVAAALKRNHDPPRIVAAMLTAEIAEKQTRSIRYQMGVAIRSAKHHENRGAKFDADPGSRLLAD